MQNVNDSLLSLTHSVYIDPLGTVVRLFFPETKVSEAWAASFYNHGATDKKWEDMDCTGSYRVIAVTKHYFLSALVGILDALYDDEDLDYSNIKGRKYRKMMRDKALAGLKERCERRKDQAAKLIAEFPRLGRKGQVKEELYAGQTLESMSDEE